MSKFNELFSKSKKSVSRDLKYSENDAQLLYSMLQQFWKEHPEASNQEAFSYFQMWFFQENQDTSTFPTIKGNNAKYNICKYLVGNKNALWEAYDKILKEEARDGVQKKFKENSKVPSNRRSGIRLVTLEALSYLRDIRNIIGSEQTEVIKRYINLTKKQQKEALERCKDADQVEAIKTFAQLLKGDEFTQLHNMLKYQEKLLQEELKENYIESILRVSEKLDRFGLLERDNETHHKIMERMNLSGLTYSYDQDESNSKSIKTFFTRENIEKIDLYKLSMLNAFLINRYTKEIDGLNKTFFIVSELDLWDQIKNAVPNKDGKISIKIDDKELEGLYKKMNFLDAALSDILENHSDTSDENVERITLENGSTRSFLKIDVNDIMIKLQKDLGQEYRKHFGKSLPNSPNNFESDLDSYRIMKAAVFNTYKLKDLNMIATLMNLYQDKSVSKNWGVILEDKPVQDCSKILLGFDVEGFNMPIRLHIDKDLVTDFLKANQDTTKMPIYEGNSDFVYNGKIIGTQVLMPLFMRQKKALKNYDERHSDESPLKNYIRHIQFLKDETKFPEHLKVDGTVKVKGKKQKTKVRPPRRFVNLMNGDMFVEEKDGRLTKLDVSKDVREK